MKNLLSVFLFFASSSIFSPQLYAQNHNKHAEESEKESHEGHNDHGSEHGEESIGKNQAIISVRQEGEEFKLSGESESVLKITTSKVTSQGKNLYKVPRSSLVSFKSEIGVYVKRAGWFRLSEVIILKQSEKDIHIKSQDILETDEVVISGVAYLRIAQLQASGQGGKGHAH